MANTSVEASLDSPLRLYQQNQIKFPIQAMTQLTVTYLRRPQQKKQQIQKQQEEKKPEPLLSVEQHIYSVLKTAYATYGNCITHRTIVCLMGKSKKVTKRVLIKMFNNGLLRRATKEECMSLAAHFNKSVIRGSHNYLRKNELMKLIKKLKSVFIITKKGEELLDLFDTMYKLCPLFHREERIMALRIKEALHRPGFNPAF